MKVVIEKLDHFGRGIVHINGKICFVEKALPGEVVKIKIVKETKKYLLARVDDYYQLSDDRVDEVCCYCDVCGGCNLSHLSIDEENEFKCLKVKELLSRFGGLDLDKVSDTVCVNEYFYRNKVVLHGDGNVLGYYEKDSNKVVHIEKCLLADNKINRIIEVLNDLVSSCDIREALIRVSNDSDEIMVSLKGDIDDFSVLLNEVDVLVINGDVVLGEGSIISFIGDKKYYLSSESFFQVNKKMTKCLYDEVLNVVKEVKPSKILDLYCGTGSISIYVSDYCNEVVGVDYSLSNINDANRNKVLNNSLNTKFICDKVENVIDKFSEFDLVIVDPPRSGLDSKTIENIMRIAAGRVVYVSCDPVTLARDLKIISDDYLVETVKPFNMFPRTHHVEVVCVLKHR